jgi:molybdopterin-guanine dinucleotide biosynthesis protein A
MDAEDVVVGVLLAGGKSSRMGGGDKCLLPLAGRPILAHVLERLKPQVSDIVINANGDLSRFIKILTLLL